MVDLCLNKKGGKPSLRKEADLILQQVNILFDTTPTEVLGDIGFGTQYDKHLYDTRLSASNLQRLIENDLSQLTLFGWRYNVKVYLLKGTERDIAVINITFYKGNQTLEKTYKIT